MFFSAVECRWLSQEYSYGNDILSTRPHNFLTIADNARLMQMVIPDQGNQIRRGSQDIQFLVIECIKYITTPRLEDNTLHTGARMSSRPGWNIETTWNWLLQTMLALKLLPDDEHAAARCNTQTRSQHLIDTCMYIYVLIYIYVYDTRCNLLQQRKFTMKRYSTLQHMQCVMANLPFLRKHPVKPFTIHHKQSILI